MRRIAAPAPGELRFAETTWFAYCSAVARALAVQARDGASREKLFEIGRLAVGAWPE